MKSKDKISPKGTASRREDGLPYKVELWQDGGECSIERVLARAVSLQLARAIFKTATDEYPGRRLTLRKGNRIVADSSP